MARVTVEDCLLHSNNRFHLVMEATKRARQLATTGAEPAVKWDNDKPTVVALREIAAGHTNLVELEEKRVRGLLETEEKAEELSISPIKEDSEAEIRSSFGTEQIEQLPEAESMPQTGPILKAEQMLEAEPMTQSGVQIATPEAAETEEDGIESPSEPRPQFENNAESKSDND